MLLHGWSSPSKPKMGKQPRIAAKPFSCFISNSRDSSLQCTTLPHLWTISRSTFIVCICFPDWMISLPLWTAPDCRHLWAVEKSIVCTLFALCLHFARLPQSCCNLLTHLTQSGTVMSRSKWGSSPLPRKGRHTKWALKLQGSTSASQV